ncbi:hypothetical protein DL96DRAFT_1586529 [Flagelloscypha sp. PMI_526]|nr:hypothetical protein DL96DRAFT_1586529 [Flagelloscypha sp. PMI_526]
MSSLPPEIWTFILSFFDSRDRWAFHSVNSTLLNLQLNERYGTVKLLQDMDITSKDLVKLINRISDPFVSSRVRSLRIQSEFGSTVKRSVSARTNAAPTSTSTHLVTPALPTTTRKLPRLDIVPLEEVLRQENGAFAATLEAAFPLMTHVRELSIIYHPKSASSYIWKAWNHFADRLTSLEIHFMNNSLIHLRPSAVSPCPNLLSLSVAVNRQINICAPEKYAEALAALVVLAPNNLEELSLRKCYVTNMPILSNRFFPRLRRLTCDGCMTRRFFDPPIEDPTTLINFVAQHNGTLTDLKINHQETTHWVLDISPILKVLHLKTPWAIVALHLSQLRDTSLTAFKYSAYGGLYPVDDLLQYLPCTLTWLSITINTLEPSLFLKIVAHVPQIHTLRISGIEFGDRPLEYFSVFGGENGAIWRSMAKQIPDGRFIVGQISLEFVGLRLPVARKLGVKPIEQWEDADGLDVFSECVVIKDRKVRCCLSFRLVFAAF